MSLYSILELLMTNKLYARMSLYSILELLRITFNFFDSHLYSHPCEHERKVEWFLIYVVCSF